MGKESKDVVDDFEWASIGEANDVGGGVSYRVELEEDPEDPREMCDGVTRMYAWHSRYRVGDNTVDACFTDWLASTFRTLDTSRYPKAKVHTLVHRWLEQDPDRQEAYDAACRDHPIPLDAQVEFIACELEAMSSATRDEGGAVLSIMECAGLVWQYLYLGDHSNLWLTSGKGVRGHQWDVSLVGVIYTTPALLKEIGIDFDTNDEVHELLTNEVKQYSNYLQGQVYGYVVSTPFEEHAASGRGFYDEEEAAFSGSEDAKAVMELMKDKDFSDELSHVPAAGDVVWLGEDVSFVIADHAVYHASVRTPGVCFQVYDSLGDVFVVRELIELRASSKEPPCRYGWTLAFPQFWSPLGEFMPGLTATPRE
jgi:hypothetical protein